ncbi:MAG: hypothetical protein R3D84_07595 [Paracoccaceae bacterium]
MIHGEVEADRAASTWPGSATGQAPATRLKVIENYQRFSVSLPKRGTPGSTPVPHHADVRHLRRDECRLGPAIRAGSRELLALPGEPGHENPTFRRSNAWDATAAEVCAVRGGVGINEVQNFGKYRVTGPRARAWLDRIMAGLIPKPGRLALNPMLAGKRQNHRRFHRHLPQRDRVSADRKLWRAGLAHALVRTACRRRGAG